ncbi:MAG: hypothetical protein ACR2OH_04635, partial [Microthrixaceae bacterium]
MPTSSHPRTTGRYFLACVASVATVTLIGAVGAPSVGAQADDESDPAATATTTTTAPETSGSTGAGSQRANAEASVASLQVERSTVRAQLAQATSARNRQHDEWSLRHLAAGAAVIEAQWAATAFESARLAVVAAEQRVREYATEAYINPPMIQSQAVLSIEDADDMSWAHDLLTITADDQRRVVGELEVARKEAQVAAEEAKEASAQAAAMEAEEKSNLDELEAAVARQEQLA